MKGLATLATQWESCRSVRVPFNSVVTHRNTFFVEKELPNVGIKLSTRPLGDGNSVVLALRVTEGLHAPRSCFSGSGKTFEASQ